MDNRLGYFFIETPDVEKAKVFYAGLFGWTFEHDTPTYTHVQAAGAEGETAFGLVKGEKKDFSHLFFQVADVDAAAKRVTELGGQAAIPSDAPSGRNVVVCDDQGASFSLWSPPKG
ncbi:VOC family protein [Brevundimonas sp.]|jgi:predicted enzyme related to lactoylglutathione lyase|uniref:VOC family protein n=1 Tax=Brevundimonas sp. TaxID=1871086 RepID=UPI0037BF702B